MILFWVNAPKKSIWNHHQVITDLLLFTVVLRQGPFASPLAGERSVGDTLSCWEISNRLNLFIDLLYSLWIIIVTIVTIARWCKMCEVLDRHHYSRWHLYNTLSTERGQSNVETKSEAVLETKFRNHRKAIMSLLCVPNQAKSVLKNE